MAIHDRTWEDRPTDVANLLNPAFLGVVLVTAVGRYRSVKDTDMPFEFAFLLMPIVLHSPTRLSLPRSAQTMMQTWLQQHREALLGFSQRAKELVPFTRESILFASHRRVLKITEQGRLSIGPQKLTKPGPYTSGKEEVADILKKAGLIGAWLAEAGNPTTVFAMLGVRP